MASRTLIAGQPICLDPRRRSTTRADALNRLRAVMANAANSTGSLMRARLCLEGAHGDSARMQDRVARMLEQGDEAEDPLPTDSCTCLVCGVDGVKDAGIFDCGHNVCFACATGMLLANYRDANFAMPCPYSSLERCEGKITVLALDDILVRARNMSCEQPEAPEQWEHYMRRVNDAMLRAAGMFPCTTPSCATSCCVLFVPAASSRQARRIECDGCGLSICSRCTHQAGKLVPNHAPLPCARRVEIEDLASTLKQELADIERATREATRTITDELRTRLHRDALVGRHHRLADVADFHSFTHESLDIDAQVLSALRIGEGTSAISYTEIFSVAAEVMKKAAEEEHWRKAPSEASTAAATKKGEASTVPPSRAPATATGSSTGDATPSVQSQRAVDGDAWKPKHLVCSKYTALGGAAAEKEKAEVESAAPQGGGDMAAANVGVGCSSRQTSEHAVEEVGRRAGGEAVAGAPSRHAIISKETYNDKTGLDLPLKRDEEEEAVAGAPLRLLTPSHTMTDRISTPGGAGAAAAAVITKKQAAEEAGTTAPREAADPMDMAAEAGGAGAEARVGKAVDALFSRLDEWRRWQEWETRDLRPLWEEAKASESAQGVDERFRQRVKALFDGTGRQPQRDTLVGKLLEWKEEVKKWRARTRSQAASSRAVASAGPQGGGDTVTANGHRELATLADGRKKGVVVCKERRPRGQGCGPAGSREPAPVREAGRGEEQPPEAAPPLAASDGVPRLLLPSKGWCASFVSKNTFNIRLPSLGELVELLRRHQREDDAAVVEQVAAGAFSEPEPEPNVTDEEFVMRTSKPCPTGCGWHITKNQGCNHMTCSRSI